MWIQCNSLHPLFQWKSRMCAFPSASWPAWTWLAGCLEKWHDINKTMGSSIPGLAAQVRHHLYHQPKNTSSKHCSEPLLRVGTAFIISRLELTVSTSMCVQGSVNKTYIIPVSWNQLPDLIGTFEIQFKNQNSSLDS